MPCHRVVASNGFLGGFQGQVGACGAARAARSLASPSHVSGGLQWGLRAPALASKVALLKAEGVKVSEDGFVSADAILRSL